MNEKDLNRTIVKSIKKIGWAHKISDDAGNFTGTSQKPFDYFGVTKNFIIYGESKFIKGIYSFNFKRLEDHQIEALSSIYRESGNHADYVLPLVSVGFWEPHKYLYILFFHILTITNFIEEDKISLKKKEIQSFIDKGKFLSVKKGEVQNVETIPDIVI